ncbi:Sh, partial [Symbiodinium sp. KB8]
VLPPPPPPVYDRTCCGLCRSDTPGKVWDFLRSPINLIDLLAILPFYIEWALPSTGGVGLTVFRILRLTRIFRIFKLSKYSKGMQMMGRVIMASADAMGLLLFFIAIGVVVFGSIMFFAEAGEYDAATGVYMRTTFTGDGKEPTPFTSIPMAFWYVIVTATTVGYGEMVPTSTVGQLVGVLVMLAGILVLALPITVFGAQFAVEYAAATEEENMEEEEYEYDEYGTPYSPDDRDFPDDGSHVLTPAMLKAASASAGQQAKQKSFAQLDPDVRPRAGNPPGQSVKEMVAKAGAPPVLLQEADAESTSLQSRTMPPEGGQGSWRAVPAVDAIPDDLRTISEDAASSVQSASEVGTGTPAVTAQAAEPLSPQARSAHGPSHTPSLPTSVAGGSRTGASLLTPQSSGKRSIKDLVALMRSHGMQGSASIAPAPSMVSAGPEPSLPGSVQAAGAQAEGGMKRTASVSSAGAGAAGSRRPFASPMPATPLQGAPAAGEGKDLHTVSSRSRGAGVPAPAGAGRGGPTPAGKPTPRVNRARHSIFGAARGGGAAAKADPERDRKNRVTEHILANNPVAKARVTAMRQSGSLTASPAAPAATFSKGTGRSKFQAVAAAALSQASVGGTQALASGVSPAVVAGISEDAAAARRGVEELTSLVRGLMSELKSVRAEVRALRKGTLPTPRGSSSSRHAPFQDGADSDGSSAAPSLVSLPRGERRGAASTTPSHHKPATPVKAVDGVDAVAMDAIGGSASSELDAGTGSAASAHRKRQHGAASSDHVQAMTEAITQRVAASVSAALSQQLEARLAAAGIGPAPQAEP